MRAAVVILVVAAASAGCATTMVVETEPAGARIYVDGKAAGEAPVVTTQFTSTGGRLHVTADADGYDTAHIVVTQSEWFLWPAILAVTPLLGVPFVVIPFIGPVITLVWAVATSPTLLSLLFIQRYPERVKISMRPKTPGGLIQPTDGWTIPDDAVPNPPPLPAQEPPPPPDYTVPPVQPPQPSGGNPVP